MLLRKVATAAASVPLLAIVLTLSPAQAATPTTVTDPHDAHQSCADIRKVVATATYDKYTFVVTMQGNACSTIKPAIKVDPDHNGSMDCQAGPSKVKCGPPFPYTAKISPTNPKQWTITFSNASIDALPTIGFQVVTASNGHTLDSAPNTGEASLKIG